MYPEQLKATEGLIDGESTASYGIEGITPGETATTVEKQGTYGKLTLKIADGTFTPYVIDSNVSTDANYNSVLAGLSGADNVIDDFTVTLSDGLGGSTTAKLSFPIQGYGIKIGSVATDDKLTLLRLRQVLQFLVNNPNQELTIEFAGSSSSFTFGLATLSLQRQTAHSLFQSRRLIFRR